MFRTQTNIIRGLTKQQYKLLSEMCRYANNLYNVALVASVPIVVCTKQKMAPLSILT